jgi:hypothetical protein
MTHYQCLILFFIQFSKLELDSSNLNPDEMLDYIIQIHLPHMIEFERQFMGILYSIYVF